MRWTTEADGEVGRGVGLIAVLGSAVGSGAVSVWTPGGVIGRRVGVAVAAGGSWHARLTSVNKSNIVSRGCLKWNLM